MDYEDKRIIETITQLDAPPSDAPSTAGELHLTLLCCAMWISPVDPSSHERVEVRR